jgi:capsular exopolysaccharide synthesis family protein
MAAQPLPSAEAGSARGGDLDLRYWGHVLWRGRLLVGTAAMVGLGLAVLAGFLQTPLYQAAVLMQIEPPPPTFLTVTDALVGGGGYWQNADFYNTEFKVLRSKGLGEQVVAKLELGKAPPYQGHPDPGALFMTHVQVEPVPESRLVHVLVTHTDPREAVRWSNTLADVYIEQSLSTRVESARRAYDWLQGRLEATQKSIRESQDKFYKTYQSQDLFVPEGTLSVVTTSIAKLNEDFIDVQRRHIGLEAALKQIAQIRARGGSLDTVPQVAADELANGLATQLAGLELELVRLREKYKEGHPEVQKLQAQKEQLVRAKSQRTVQIVSGLQAELSQLSRREVEIKAAIDEHKAQAATHSRKGAELDALRREADSSKNLYDVLLQKLNETDLAASIRSNNVTLVERASQGQRVRPQKGKIALAGLLLGLALGVGLVLGREYLDNTIKDPEEVERYLHQDLLAAIPRFNDPTTHPVTEAYQNLRTALLFARKDEGGQVVLVTAATPQEGKTTTLVNLAALLAVSGERVVVLDCDLRRAQLNNRLGLSREPGLTDLFVKHQPLDAIIRPSRMANLFVLTAGALPPSPPALLARKALGTLLDELRTRFDWVLIDSPPLASVTDALLLSRHADVVLMVVQHNKVDRKLVKRSLSALVRATPNVLGVVLNAVDLKAGGYHYYYYSQDEAQRADERSKRRPVAAGS